MSTPGSFKNGVQDVLTSKSFNTSMPLKTFITTFLNSFVMFNAVPIMKQWKCVETKPFLSKVEPEIESVGIPREQSAFIKNIILLSLSSTSG